MIDVRDDIKIIF